MLFKTPEQLHASLLINYVHTIFAFLIAASSALPYYPHYHHHNPHTLTHVNTGAAESLSTISHICVITEGNRVRRMNLFVVREDIIPYMPQE